MTRRTLSLKRERLAELTEQQLGDVVGANYSGECLSLNDDCPTMPVAYCLTLAGPRCIF